MSCAQDSLEINLETLSDQVNHHTSKYSRISKVKSLDIISTQLTGMSYGGFGICGSVGLSGIDEGLSGLWIKIKKKRNE